MKTTLSALAIFTALVFSQSVFADSFCGDRNRNYISNKTFEGDLTGNECLEIGAGNIGDPSEYVGAGINMNLLNGSLLSVLGYFKDSTVNSGATVWITKKPRVYSHDYDPGFPSIGTNIDIKSGGKIYVFDGGTLKDSLLNGGTVYVSNAGDVNDPGIAINNTVNSGGNLYAYSGGKSEGTTVNNGGKEYIQDNGTAKNSIVNDGGYQYVRNSGSATGSTINQGGSQHVYNQGIANNTVINRGGVQHLLLGGIATGSIINQGNQFVYNDAVAKDTIINQGGIQYVFDKGTVNNTVINSGGIQYLYLNSSVSTAGVANNTKVYGTGAQNIQQGGKAIGVELYDNAVQRIYADSSATDVTINNNAKSWLSVGGAMLGTTQLNDQGQLQMVVAGGTGATYAENVILRGKNTSVAVIANVADTDFAHIETLSGNGIVGFKTINDANGDKIYSHLKLGNLSGSLHFLFNTSIEDGRGDYLFIRQGSGQHLVSVADSGAEITDPNQKRLDLITDESRGAGFSLASMSGANIKALDGGTYMYTLNQRSEDTGEIWYLSAIDSSTSKPDPNPKPLPVPDPEDITPPVITQPTTTPSTDAVLSMSVASQLIFNNEMQNLRSRKGVLQQDESNAGSWVRMTGSKNNIATDHTHFKLEQSGIEIGADKAVNLENGKAFIGGFTSYGNADIKHARGGTSKVDSYSVGAYATYFDTRGLYVDGVLKYNHFSNELKAISTNGSSIKSDYGQNALGASVEVGYNTSVIYDMWVEPYAKLSYVQVEGKDISLSNGMKANIGDQNSLMTELGLNLGKTFLVGETSAVTPYIKAAWVHEYIDNNSTVINDRNKFTTNLSGDMGKVGVGIDAKVSKQVNLFAEVDYAKGNKIEAPIQGNLGLRFNF
ncbi:Adhesin/invasin TibA autotransporter precursor [Pragia fontium]|uniref:Outer membrane autotransporter barrel domain-containing protein n=1 Tax=Pragia fontium DSM 5563 = ATCC 49100 TaxID=1122977 RepID=A0AAJ4W824_9GAMM|nr:BafA family autotransporter [Pragia fontium]SFC09003.1 outer membrane autotransporter barrel domain-containing protein [Pragia fontium DSM 5563 = ATCC 49100]SUB81449.1 Adhesin/invasin TibA autotransporter precursor [Pragia fontium]